MLVTYYTFGGREVFKIGVSETRMTTWIASKKTKYQFVDVSGFGAEKFYDSEDEMKRCIAQDQESFDESMMGVGLKLGYTPVSKEVEVEVNGAKLLEIYEARLSYVKKKIVPKQDGS